MEPVHHLSDVFDVDTFDSVWESPVAYVTRGKRVSVNSADRGELDGLVAIKSASYLPEFSKQPHDIIKELRLLSNVSHPNVINVLGSLVEQSSSSLHFWMPYVPLSLCAILSSPGCSPHQYPAINYAREAPFVDMARSLIFQILNAMQFIHETCKIAHRDIKPQNVLVTQIGYVKLIDFGIAWHPTTSVSSDILWREPAGEMCPQISSGPYRAPETIFGPSDYDPYAVDLWSAGATFAEFFTRFRFDGQDNWEDDDYGDNINEGCTGRQLLPFINPPVSPDQRGTWLRDALFDARRGSIGLAWSIFKTRGSPDDHTWPTFKLLPDATKVTFEHAQPIDLRNLLPNLPAGLPNVDASSQSSYNSHFPPKNPLNTPLDLIQRFLVYPPERRIKAGTALNHPWIASGPLVLPPGYPLRDPDLSTSQSTTSLEDLIASAMRGWQSSE